MTFDSRETSRFLGRPYELYRFNTDDAEYRFTSEDTARRLLDADYAPAVISHNGTSQSGEVSGGHITVTIPRDHVIAAMFVSFIPSTPLFLTIIRGHDGEAQTMVVFTGRVQSCNFTPDDACELNCAPESELLKREIATAVFQRQCNRVLFDAGCRIDASSWRLSGPAVNIAADGLTVSAEVFASMPNGWWTSGYIEMGAHRRMIVAHSARSVTLLNAMPGLSEGRVVNIYPGCDRVYGTCVQKFNNGGNFFGYQWIPEKNPFASGIT